jgi:DNA-binding CsgD family transcriptional regulator
MERLTDREYDILVMLKDGRENSEMADIASISRHTVKAHVSSILKKLEAKNRTGAIYIAVKKGLI